MPADTIQQIEADPDFAAYSPVEKRQLMDRWVKSLPDYSAMDPHDQQAAVNRAQARYPDAGTGMPSGTAGTQRSVISGLGEPSLKEIAPFLDKPYVWGGEPGCPSGTDCSGLTKDYYGQKGIKLPRTAREQWSSDTGLKVTDKKGLQPGDQLFYQGTQKALKAGEASHTGVYLGNDRVLQESSVKGKSVISHISEMPKGFLGAKRYGITDQVAGGVGRSALGVQGGAATAPVLNFETLGIPQGANAPQAADPFAQFLSNPLAQGLLGNMEKLGQKDAREAQQQRGAISGLGEPSLKEVGPARGATPGASISPMPIHEPGVLESIWNAAGQVLNAPVAPVKLLQYQIEQALGASGKLPKDLREQERLNKMPALSRMSELADQPLRNLGSPESEMYRRGAYKADSRVGQLLESGGGMAAEMGANPAMWIIPEATSAKVIGGKGVMAVSGGFAASMAAPYIANPRLILEDPAKFAIDATMAGMSGLGVVHGLELAGVETANARAMVRAVKMKTGGDANGATRLVMLQERLRYEHSKPIPLQDANVKDALSEEISRIAGTRGEQKGPMAGGGSRRGPVIVPTGPTAPNAQTDQDISREIAGGGEGGASKVEGAVAVGEQPGGGEGVGSQGSAGVRPGDEGKVQTVAGKSEEEAAAVAKGEGTEGTQGTKGRTPLTRAEIRAAERGKFPEEEDPKTAVPAAAAVPAPVTGEQVGEGPGAFRYEENYPVGKILVNVDVPQFKEGADAKTGVVPHDRLEGGYERLGTGPIVVWEKKNGTSEVITGRHRLDLAKQNGEEHIPAQVVQEENGFTPHMAAMFDAEANIRDGKGTVKDYARYFNSTQGELTEGQARQRGLLSVSKGRSGWDIGRNASDDVRAQYLRDRITEPQAVAIARAGPGDANLQQVGARYALQGRDPQFIHDVMQAANASRPRGAKASDQVILFGEDDSAMQAMEAQAKKAGEIQKGISERINAVVGAAKRPEIAKGMGVDVNDPEAIAREVAKLRAEQKRWGNWAVHPDLVAATRGDHGFMMARGAPSDGGLFGGEETAKQDAGQIIRSRAAAYNPSMKEMVEHLASKGYSAREAVEAIREEIGKGKISADSRGRLLPGKVTQKSAGEFELTSDDKDFGQGGFQFNRTAPTFYSKAEQAIREKLPNSAGVEQVKRTLLAAGVKPDEMKWSGLDQLLNSKTKVTKAELLEHLAENNVRVEEVVKGGAGVFPKMPDELTRAGFTQDSTNPGYSVVRYKGNDFDSADDVPSQYREALQKYFDEVDQYHAPKGATKFGQYQTPGGENYRELLLTLPPRESPGSRWDKAPTQAEWLQSKGIPDTAENQRKYFHAWNEDRLNVAEANVQRRKPEFRSNHWEEPNVLAHVRFNDRTGPGGEKILHIEEMQSDWHQKGRAKGYQATEQEAQAARRAVGDYIAEFGERHKDIPARELVKAMSRDELHAYHELLLRQERATNEHAVPAAPFSKNWHELAAKRMLRWASEHGYDRVTWTTGETQAERYDLSKQVDQVRVRMDTGLPDASGHPAVEESGQVEAVKDGHAVITKDFKSPSDLAEIIGKEIAERALSKVEENKGTTKHGVASLEGLDLKVGGQGMKGFYDKILPDTFNKLGKRFGAKVGETEIAQGRSSDGEPLDSHLVHSIDITPSMRESAVREGFPLFHRETATGVRYEGSEGKPRRMVAKVAADGHIYLTEAGKGPLAALIGHDDFTGVAPTRSALSRLKASVLDVIQDPQAPSAQKAEYGQLLQAIRLAESRSGRDITFSVAKAGDRLSLLKQVKREEIVHTASRSLQVEQGGAPVERLLEHPLAKKASASLMQQGYESDPRILAEEQLAKLVSGQGHNPVKGTKTQPGGGLGLTRGEAKTLMGHYFSILKEHYGDDIRAVLEHGTAEAREINRAKSEGQTAGRTAEPAAGRAGASQPEGVVRGVGEGRAGGTRQGVRPDILASLGGAFNHIKEYFRRVTSKEPEPVAKKPAAAAPPPEPPKPRPAAPKKSALDQLYEEEEREFDRENARAAAFFAEKRRQGLVFNQRTARWEPAGGAQRPPQPERPAQAARPAAQPVARPAAPEAVVSAADLKNTYRQFAKDFHPDRFNVLGRGSAELSHINTLFQRLNETYDRAWASSTNAERAAAAEKMAGLRSQMEGVLKTARAKYPDMQLSRETPTEDQWDFLIEAAHAIRAEGFNDREDFRREVTSDWPWAAKHVEKMYEESRAGVRRWSGERFEEVPKAEKETANEPVTKKTAASPTPGEAPAAPGGGAEPGAAGDGVQRGPAGGGSDRGEAAKDERIITARPELTREVDTSVVPEAIRAALDDYQQQGVAKAVDAMRREGGFLLADGTGTGKTRQILGTAKVFADEGKKVLIVAPNEVLGKPGANKGIISGSYRNDSDAMKVPFEYTKGEIAPAPGKILVGTYTQIKNLLPHVDGDTVVLFDESHQLKNSDSATAQAGMEMADRAHAVLFASATPADKPTHLEYMARAGVLEGKTPDEMFQSLGLVTKTINRGKRNEQTLWTVNPKVGAEEVYRRMSSLFDRMTEKGLMLKREISMKGVNVEIHRVELPPEAHKLMREIEQFFGGEKNQQGESGLRGLKLANMLMHQRRQQETFKIEKVADMVKESIERGRQVVVFASRVNASEVGKNVLVGYLGDEPIYERETLMSSEGSMPLLRKALEARGIKDYTELHGGTDIKAPAAMDAFQGGKARVIIATIESGGTGINLDDVIGNAPRDLIIMTAPFSAVQNVQAAGRVWRKNTKSYPTIRYVFADTDVDAWNASIIATKMKTLGATVQGEVGRLDVENPDLLTVGDYADPERGKARTAGTVGEGLPALEWKGFETRKGKMREVAPATPAFWDWWQAEGGKGNQAGVSVNQYKGEWQVWRDKAPVEETPAGGKPDVPAVEPQQSPPTPAPATPASTGEGQAPPAGGKSEKVAGAGQAVDTVKIARDLEWTTSAPRAKIAERAAENIYARLQAKEPVTSKDTPEMPPPVVRELTAKIKAAMAPSRVVTAPTMRGGAPSNLRTGMVSVKAAIERAVKNAVSPDVKGQVTDRVLGARNWVTNLNFLKKYGGADAVLAAREGGPAAVKAQVNQLAYSAFPAIIKKLGNVGAWDEFRTMLVESRLRGIRDRWNDLAGKAQTEDVLADYKYRGEERTKLSDTWRTPMLALESGNKDFRGLSERVDAMAGDGDEDGVRRELETAFDAAAANTGSTHLSDRFDAIRSAPRFKEALDIYKEQVERTMAQSHAQNEGIFSDALGPLDTYYPLLRMNEDGKPEGVTAAKHPTFNSPENLRNHFATGQAEQYDTSLDGLVHNLYAATKANSKAKMMDTLGAKGLIVPSKDGQPLEVKKVKQYEMPMMKVGERTFPAVLVDISPPRQLIADGKSVWLGAQKAWVPKWLVSEMQPFFAEWGGRHYQEFNDIGLLNKLSLAGPMEAVFHGGNLLGTAVAETPLIGESLAKKIASSNTLTKPIAVAHEMLTTDVRSPEAIRDLQEMAKLGSLPSRVGRQTLSRKLAEQTGAEHTRNVFGAGLFGPHGADVKARLVMYRAAKAMAGIDGPVYDAKGNLTVTPKQALAVADYVDRLGQYNPELTGSMIRAIKNVGWAPFAVASNTMVRNGYRFWLSAFNPKSLPTEGTVGRKVSVKIAQQLSAGAVGLTVTWAVAHKAQTGKWPWEDQNSRFLEIPVSPRVSRSKFGRAVWGNNAGQAYVGLGYLNPIGFRGSGVMGMRGAYNVKMAGGNVTQIKEQFMLGPVNAGLQIATAGPAAHFATNLAGVAPYAYSLRDQRTGRPFPQLISVGPKAEGLPKIKTAIIGANPLSAGIGGAMGVGPEAEQHERLASDYAIAKVFMDIIAPRLIRPQRDIWDMRDRVEEEREKIEELDRGE